MTRSIFDPGGGEAERSGSRYLGPKADNISHMPGDVTDGQVHQEQDPAADEDSKTRRIAHVEKSRRAGEKPQRAQRTQSKTKK